MVWLRLGPCVPDIGLLVVDALRAAAPTELGVRRASRIAAAVTVLLGLIGVASIALAPPRPAALPDGAAALALRTQMPRLWPPRGFGCPMALVPELRVWREADEMVFLRASDQQRVVLVWPPGFSARLVRGRAELVMPNGAVLAREGDIVTNLAGEAADNGDILVCVDAVSRPEVVPAYR